MRKNINEILTKLSYKIMKYVPTYGEKMALKGSFGVPGTGNEYLTKDDTTTVKNPAYIAARIALKV